MATYQPPKINTAFITYVSLVSQTDSRLNQTNPTLATGDVTVSIDGAAAANLATLPTVTPAAGKRVKVSLSAAEMNGDNISIVFSDAAGAEWCDLTVNIQTSARQIDDLAYPATSGRSMVVDAAGLVDANTVKVGPTGSGTAQTAGDIIGDTNDIQARLPAALTGDGNIKADTLRVGGTLQTAGDIIGDTNDIQARLPAALTANGNMKSSLVEILTTALTETGGLLAGGFKKFFNVGSPTGTLNSIPDAVAGASGGLLIAGSNAATTVNITGNITGNLSGSVGSVTGAVGSVTGAVGSVAGAVGSVTGSVGSVVGNVGGNVVGTVDSVSGSVGSVVGAVGSVTGNVGGNVVGSVASVTGSVGSVVGHTPQTGDNFARLGVAGAGLTAVPWNAAWDAEVQSEVDDALVARSLDKLVLASGTADSGSTTTMVDAARTEGDADYWKGARLLFTSGVIAGQTRIITDFNAATDTFTFAPVLTQSVGTETYVILPGISVWDDVLAEHLVVGSTGAALNAAGAAGDPWSTALPGAYGAGTAGKIVGDNITGNSFTRLGAPVGASISADVAGVQSDTNDIQARLPAALSAGGNIKADVLSLGGVVQSLTDLKDFADDGYDPATNKVQGVVLTDTVTTYTGNTVQTGDNFARLGAPAGASVSADIAAIEAQTDDIGTAGAGLTAVPWNAAWDAEVQSEVDDALVAQRLDELLNADSDIDGAAPPTVGSVFHELMSKTAGSFTFDQTTDSNEALRDNTGTAGAGLTALGDTRIANLDATVSSRLATAGYTAPPSVGAIADQVWDETLSGHLGAGSTGEALNGAGAAGDPWLTALPGAYGAGSAGKIVGDNVNATISSRLASASISLSAGAVTVGTNNDKTGYGLSAAAVQAVWDALTSALTTAGSIGKRLVDYLTGDIFARLGAPAGASVSADIAAVKAETASIQSDTDNIQTRLPAALVSGRMDSSVGAMAAGVVTAAAVATDAIDADALAADAITEIQAGLSTLTAAGIRTAVGLASANLDTQLTTIDDFLDTEVAAIKAKTDNLPSDPADASDIAASFTTVNSKLDTIDDFLDTEVAAIKAKTDNLPASPAAVGSAMTLTSGERDSVATALLKLDWTGITGEAARSVLNAMRFLRNKWSVAAGTLTVTKEDDAATAWAGTVTTDAAAVPIIGNDPT